MIENPFIGSRMAPFTTRVDRDRVRRFALAIGDDDPVFHDLAVARAAGHPDVPLPPTLLFGIELERPGSDELLKKLGLTVDRVMHAEQRFTYHAPVYAGEELTFATVVADIYTRVGRTFIAQETEVTREGEPVAGLRQVLMAGAAEVTA